MIVYRAKDNAENKVRAEQLTDKCMGIVNKLVNGYDKPTVRNDDGKFGITFKDVLGKDVAAFPGDYVCTKNYKKFFVLRENDFEDRYEEDVTEEEKALEDVRAS